MRGPRVIARGAKTPFGVGSCASSGVISTTPALASGGCVVTMNAARNPAQMNFTNVSMALGSLMNGPVAAMEVTSISRDQFFQLASHSGNRSRTLSV
jgi:hypothetical protein